MSFNSIVKEKIARVIGEYFTTNDIVNVFNDANIQTNRELFAKWRITLDAFSKMSDPEVSIPHILSVFCHPLSFQDQQIRKNFIKNLNAILAYEKLEIKATDKSVVILSDDGFPISHPSTQTEIPRTPIDDIREAIIFFKDEYNKVKMSGLTYEYFLGEEAEIGQVGGRQYDFSERLEAIKQLKCVGFITEYTTEAKVNDSGSWVYAICKIDESKLTQKEAPPATDAGVEAITKKIIHEHTHLFTNSIQEKDIDLNVRNGEENVINNGKKRIHLPKFKSTDWSKITIRFIDDRNVVINADKKEQIVSDYEALGFSNEKQNKPNSAWLFLYGLAQNNGETKPQPNPIPDNIKQQKSQLSSKLKAIFKNETDPFEDPTESRVYRIKINLIPPQIEEADNVGVKEYLQETMTQEYED